MNLNREAIINRLKKNGFKKFYLGSPFEDGLEEDYETVADEILSLLQPNIVPPPQLNKQDVMRWVEFEKQKPEYMDTCLITSESGFVTEAQYTGEDNLFCIGEDEIRAKAWMFLPPPFA